jgi:hypothetical protein
MVYVKTDRTRNGSRYWGNIRGEEAKDIRDSRATFRDELASTSYLKQLELLSRNDTSSSQWSVFSPPASFSASRNEAGEVVSKNDQPSRGRFTRIRLSRADVSFRVLEVVAVILSGRKSLEIFDSVVRKYA